MINKIISQIATVPPTKKAITEYVKNKNIPTTNTIPIKADIYTLLTIKRTSLSPTKGQRVSLLGYHAALVEDAGRSVVRNELCTPLAAIGKVYVPTRSFGTGTVYQTAATGYRRNITRYWMRMRRSDKRSQHEQGNYYKLFHFALSINSLIKALSEPFLRLANFLTLAFWALLTQETMRTNFSAIRFSITNNLSLMYTGTCTVSRTYTQA